MAIATFGGTCCFCGLVALFQEASPQSLTRAGEDHSWNHQGAGHPHHRYPAHLTLDPDRCQERSQTGIHYCP